MPRDIPIGNRCLLITFDHDYCLRDIYYPFIGKENHTDGHKFRFGIWVDGRCDWVKRENWDLSLEYVHESLLTNVTGGNETFGVFGPKDEQVVNTMTAVKERLWVKTGVVGIARYEGDGYHKVTNDTDEVPGNPWFICSLWLAQWYIAKAEHVEELQEAVPILEWVASRALPSGVLAEQVHPYTNQPLSVSPLTWSHAAFIATTIEYLKKIEKVYICPSCGHPLYRYEREK